MPAQETNPPVRVRYQTIEFDDFDIHIRSLRDKNQFADNLGEAEAFGVSSAQWPLFGVVWPSGEVLAHEMDHFDIKGKRILELGCGLALSSHVLNARDADITATDIHPEAGRFLDENTRLNHNTVIPFLRLGWDEENQGLGTFDAIIGSDILYEREYLDRLCGFIQRHAKQCCEVILVDPGRKNDAAFSKKMIALGFEYNLQKTKDSDSETAIPNGKILRYIRK